MPYYCSSPKCRNECGKKEENVDPERMWRDPQSVQGVLIYYVAFCDDEGNKLKTYDEIKTAQEYF